MADNKGSTVVIKIGNARNESSGYIFGKRNRGKVESGQECLFVLCSDTSLNAH